MIAAALRRALRLAPAALLLALAAAPARADFVIYQERSVFNILVGPTITEGFEAAPTGPLASLPYTRPTGIAISAPNASVVASPAQNTTPNGSKVLQVADPSQSGATSGAYTVKFALPTAVTAFGFDLGGYEGTSFTILVTGGYGPPGFQTLYDSTRGTQFIGIRSDSVFTQVYLTFSALPGGASDAVTFDQVSYSAIPEPASAALLGVGLAGAVLLARRRRAA